MLHDPALCGGGEDFVAEMIQGRMPEMIQGRTPGLGTSGVSVAHVLCAVSPSSFVQKPTCNLFGIWTS